MQFNKTFLIKELRNRKRHASDLKTQRGRSLAFYPGFFGNMLAVYGALFVPGCGRTVCASFYRLGGYYRPSVFPEQDSRARR
jgi:hypothetical protein